MQFSIKKILTVCIAALAIFFAFTYFDKWDGAVATSKTTNYQSQIKSLKKNPTEATKKCPAMIKNLKQENIELSKTNTQNTKIQKNDLLIGDCALAAGNYKQAMVSYEKIIRAKPNFDSIYLRFSQALEGDGRLTQAYRYAQLAVQLKPSSFKNQLNKARILTKLNQTVKAIDAYQKALKLAPYKKASMVRDELNTLVDRYNIEHSGA